ncbi:hypothetical protein [Aeromonas sp. NJAU223]
MGSLSQPDSKALIVPMHPALVGDPRLAIADHELCSLAELNGDMLERWIA